MQAFFFVLNRTEHLEHLLQEFAAQGIGCATVLDSKGMARILHSEEEMPIFYGLRAIVAPERRSRARTRAFSSRMLKGLVT